MTPAFYGRILLRRLPVMFVLITICTLAAVVYALSLPTVYQAESRLVVESEQIPDELAASTVQTAATEQIQIIRQRLLTRQVLLELANRQNIYADDVQRTAGSKVADMRQRIGINIRGGSRRGSRRATIVSVSFQAPTPRMAALVTNELVTLLLQQNAELRQEATAQTLEFFVQEVDRLGLEVSNMSAEILAFQEQNIDALPDSLDFRRSQQANTQERRLQIDRNIAGLHERRAALVELFESGGQITLQDQQRSQTGEERQLATLRNEYANLSVILSVDNPRLTLLNARIEALEERILEQQASRLAGASPQDGPTLSPFEIQLADIDTQLASLERQRNDVDARLAELEETIKATPGNTVALGALRREYNNLRDQYNQAVNNRALAETGQLIEALSKGQRISVIEPASPPNAPQSPNRPLIAFGGLFAGVALSAGFFLLMELLTKTVRQPGEITNKLGITALSTIPYIQTRAQYRMQRVAFVAVILAMMGIMGTAIWIVGFGDVSIDLMIEDMLDRARDLTASL